MRQWKSRRLSLPVYVESRPRHQRSQYRTDTARPMCLCKMSTALDHWIYPLTDSCGKGPQPFPVASQTLSFMKSADRLAYFGCS